MNSPQESEEQSIQPDLPSASSSPAPAAESLLPPENSARAAELGAGMPSPAAAKKMSSKNRLALGFVCFFQLCGFLCAIWYSFDPVKAFLSDWGPFFGLRLPAALPDPKRDFAGLLLVIFVENSLSQMAVDFYTEANKPRISALCRLLPIMLGIASYLRQF